MTLLFTKEEFVDNVFCAISCGRTDDIAAFHTDFANKKAKELLIQIDVLEARLKTTEALLEKALKRLEELTR